MKRILQGKTAFVTGGTGGIGAAICARFAAEGASVVAADLRQTGELAFVSQLTVIFRVDAGPVKN